MRELPTEAEALRRGLIPLMGLPFGDELIAAAKRAHDTGEDQPGGSLWGCQVVVLAPAKPPPLRYSERFTVRFTPSGDIA